MKKHAPARSAAVFFLATALALFLGASILPIFGGAGSSAISIVSAERARPSGSAAALPDIVITNITNGTLSAGDESSFNVTVQNQGNASVNGRFDVNAYIEGELEYRTITNLGAGEYANITINHTFARRGQYNLEFIADEEGWVNESDRGNNRLNITVNVSGAVPPNSSYTLNEAISKGYLEAYISGANPMEYSQAIIADPNFATGGGVFFGRCVQIQASSNSEKELSISIELKRTFTYKYAVIQDMVATAPFNFTLPSGGNVTFTMYAMCINMSKSTPSNETYFDMGLPVQGRAALIVDAVYNSSAQNASGQAALWAVTDNATREQLKYLGARDAEINWANEICNATLGLNIPQGEPVAFPPQQSSRPNDMYFLIIGVMWFFSSIFIAAHIYADSEGRACPRVFWTVSGAAFNMLGLLFYVVLRPPKSETGEYGHTHPNEGGRINANEGGNIHTGEGSPPHIPAPHKYTGQKENDAWKNKFEENGRIEDEVERLLNEQETKREAEEDARAEKKYAEEDARLAAQEEGWEEEAHTDSKAAEESRAGVRYKPGAAREMHPGNAPAPQVQPARLSKHMFCPECGSEMTPDSNICPSCKRFIQ